MVLEGKIIGGHGHEGQQEREQEFTARWSPGLGKERVKGGLAWKSLPCRAALKKARRTQQGPPVQRWPGTVTCTVHMVLPPFYTEHVEL